MSTKFVVVWTCTVRVPRSTTVPTPLSIWMFSAPSTSQLKVTEPPRLTSVGVTVKRRTDKSSGLLRLSMTPQEPTAMAASTAAAFDIRIRPVQ